MLKLKAYFEDSNIGNLPAKLAVRRNLSGFAEGICYVRMYLGDWFWLQLIPIWFSASSHSSWFDLYKVAIAFPFIISGTRSRIEKNMHNDSLSERFQFVVR
ncbi:hypothetical protein RJT34_11731 [Clitoria ternatea]|uniref:Uncharacterized protein n=1 Tax=Clitoria ternatea TaxID=43366 RepID=A0AAN9JKH6_CLITE